MRRHECFKHSFVSGISTFLQSLFGTRLPIVVAGSYTYIENSLTQESCLESSIQNTEEVHKLLDEHFSFG
ncbi:hypothetical protein VIGAN_03171200, partial [Vigna angularis var. angularis]